ncbi:MAG TPA: RRXRR domain-containing protein, partial [Ktedonobacteraceae bacterium]|nr:RRXRR domain-containing protein [Ktedonobacteraceae bacterium]
MGEALAQGIDTGKCFLSLPPCRSCLRTMVFVLDRHKKPLMPCTPRRARLLLTRRRAVVHRLQPFTIRLKDRRVQESALQPVVLKIDPGSRTTGLVLARVEEREVGEV